MNCQRCGEPVITCEQRYRTGSCWYFHCTGHVHVNGAHACPDMNGEATPRNNLTPVPELPPQTHVRLSCGHTGTVWGHHRLGAWVSCWAIVVNAGGKLTDSCQAQRKIVAVQESL